MKKCYLLILIIGLIICNSMFSLDMNESFGFNLVKDLDKNTLAFYKKKEIKLKSKTKPLGYIYYSAITKSLSAGNDSIWECYDPGGVRTRKYSSYCTYMNEHNHKIVQVNYY